MALFRTISLTGLRIAGFVVKAEVSSSLRKLIRNLEDLEKPAKRRKLMLKLAKKGRNIVKGNFDAGGRPNRWAPKKIVRNAGRRGNRPLIITGELKNSFQIRASADEAEIFTNLIKAPSLHFGGFVGRNRATFIPARPYLLIPESEVKQMERIAQLTLLFE